MLGQGRRMIRKPSWLARPDLPLRSTMSGTIPAAAACRSRLQRRRPRHGRDHDRTGFGLPPRVDDRAAVPADDVVIPLPSCGIDRLAHRPQQAQARQVVRVRPLLALAYERTDGRWRSVENFDAIFLDDAATSGRTPDSRARLRTSRWSRPRQRAVDDVAVARHPADVGRAPVGVLFLAGRTPTSWSAVCSR